jgi:hypothetical protein
LATVVLGDDPDAPRDFTRDLIHLLLEAAERRAAA